jgi:uncharacterized protein YxeA
MKKQYIWIAILSIIVLGFGYMIFKPNININFDFLKKDTTTYDESKVSVVDGDEEENEDSVSADEDNEEEETYDTNFSDFDNTDKYVGEESENEYALSSITNTDNGDYHEIVFNITSDQSEVAPYVTAKYLSTYGVIRVDLNMMMEDSSGIAYQGQRDIDIDGVSRIYHNISSDNTEELYDIGLSSSTIFDLEIEESSIGWSVILSVKYPGESDADIDLGSTEFNAEDKSIVGVSEDDGARIAGYSYSVSGSTLKFVWTVASTSDNPIPNVESKYNSENILLVTFDSLIEDKVYQAVNGMSLYGGITIETFPAGDGYEYRFFGIGGANDYQLKATTSPNQVELSIEL